MLDFIDVQQNTEEWLGLRAGKLTSSKLGVVMANYGKAFGEPAKKYAVEIAIEQITGQPASSSYSNEHMERGHEQEPVARMLYEDELFCNVTNGGFFGNAEGFIGCSPDGLVGDNGVIEIKSVIPGVHYKNVSRGGVDPAYKWQCIGNLEFTDRDWLDFVSYCEDFPEGKRLFVYRLHKDCFLDDFHSLGMRIMEFEILVEETKRKILESEYFY